MISSTVTYLEVLWTIFGVVGLTAAVVNVVLGYRDLLRTKQEAVEDGSEVAASNNVWRAVFDLINCLAISLTGVYFMTQPATNPDRPITNLTYAVTTVFFIIPIAAVLSALLDIRLRMALHTNKRRRDRRAGDPAPPMTNAQFERGRVALRGALDQMGQENEGEGR